ncbi:MAG: FAD:protein FMN transferase [Clostridia bacterium]|nr:FAD:protein FMN transferase [Clostridia bacterium]
MSCTKVFYALGTENSITTQENCAAVLDKVIGRVAEIENKMSAFKASSEISIIAANAGKRPVAVSDEVYKVLELALKISRSSGGAFDITVRPLTKLWAFGMGKNTVPKSSKIASAKNFVGYDSIELDSKNNTVFLKKAGTKLDLGGIAKGYAADEAKRLLTENGVKRALINFGGNVFALGSSFDGAPWKIGIQNPLSVRGETVLSIELSDKTVVTSAVNERFFIKGGRRYHHILNPLTGQPASSGLLSVSVIAESSMLADALSTAAFVLGAKDGVKLVRSYGAEAIFITDSGDILSSFEISHAA